MLYAEFLLKVRVRGECRVEKKAEYVSRTVLALLGTQLDQGQVRDVAHSVPEQVVETLGASSFDGHQLGCSPPSRARDGPGLWKARVGMPAQCWAR